METTDTTRPPESRITRWLRSAPPRTFSAYVIFAAFATYFCMYAFRKPFAASMYADFEGVELFGQAISFKVTAVISQILGYATSKWVGIKFCTEASYGRRAALILIFLAMAESALLLFGLLPGHLKFIALFLNGLPLGMIWGLVFGFLEGRKTSDLLGAGLSCSYIMASGVVKGIGQSWLDRGITEAWMPFVTGLTFSIPLLVAVWLLSKIPEPSHDDVAARSKRVEMDGSMRWNFLSKNLFGMLPLILLYFFLTAHRDVRDNFAKEIWIGMGYAGTPGDFTTSENWITFGVLACMAMLILVRRNRAALVAVYGMMTAGVAMVSLVTYLFDVGVIAEGRTYMTLVGLGLYLAYVPFGCVLFDRLQALLGSAGNAIYGIYLTDAVGYTGAVCVLLYKEIGAKDLDMLAFFKQFSYFTGILCVICFAVSLYGFLRSRPTEE